jgi:hypothetical protein
MKILKKIALSAFVLAAASMANVAHSATYAGQDCVARTGTLTYLSTGARNNGAGAISISCPFTRTNDGGAAAAAGVIYFVNDGKSKTCFFDNYNIDTGGLWGWRSASAVTRLVTPALAPTKPWSPFVLNCSLPAGSQVTGYFLSE